MFFSVHLCYFDEVRVESVFRNTNHRSFVFSESFQKSMGEKNRAL